MYKVYDVTMPIFAGMTVYKNKPEKQPQFDTVHSGHVTETRLHLDAHTGTHVDAPLHMIEGGATIETLPMERLVGPCRVIDLTAVEKEITRTDLEQEQIQPGDFLLLKTKNSFDEVFHFEFVYLREDGARYLCEKGIRGVGIDALGIERDQAGHPTHKVLFAQEILIMEGLRLRHVPAGEYFLVAAPLRLTGTEAAPARVLLFEGLNVQ